jgi:sec-independent protein translocase protein TatA
MGLDNPVHILLIVVLLLLLFGAKRLPEIGRSLGTGMREFKQSVTGEAHHSHDAQPPSQQQASLPPGTAQQASPAPAPPPAAQQAAPAPVPSSAQASPQDAFAQREQASSEQR